MARLALIMLSLTPHGMVSLLTTHPTTLAAEQAKLIRDKVTLSISAPENKYALADPVVLRVELRNVSDQTVVIWRAGPYGGYQDYLYDIRYTWGEPVPETLFTKRLYKDYLSWLYDELEPGESVKHDLNINLVADMSLPGLYRITLRRWCGIKDHGGGEVVSNSIVVNVKFAPTTQPAK